MQENLTRVSTFLGKYYSELFYSSGQDKYKDSGLDTFFDQRFYIQTNKTRMVVDAAMPGLTVLVTGNEIYVSKELFDHPSVLISNSLEQPAILKRPKNLYNAEIFSTIAYMICQNYTTFQFVGEFSEPIYIKYRADYETFQNSVLLFDVALGVSVEIVEEIESCSAINSVTSYNLHPMSSMKLTTFYQNRMSGISFMYRSITAHEGSSFAHMLFGKGSSNAIDENYFYPGHNTDTSLRCIVNSNAMNFHSIIHVRPLSDSFSLTADCKCITKDNASVTFLPLVEPQYLCNNTDIKTSSLNLDEIPEDDVESSLEEYINDMLPYAVLSKTCGVERFNNNKFHFLKFI